MSFQCLECGCEFVDKIAEREHYLPICPKCGKIVEAIINDKEV